MDISSFQISEKPQPCPIFHPETGDKTDIVMYVISADHPDYQAQGIEALRKSLGENNKPEDAAAIVTAQKADVIARAVTGWDNLSEGGKAVKYTAVNAVRVMKQYPWIADQVDRFCGKRANFFKRAAAA